MKKTTLNPILISFLTFVGFCLGYTLILLLISVIIGAAFMGIFTGAAGMGVMFALAPLFSLAAYIKSNKNGSMV